MSSAPDADFDTRIGPEVIHEYFSWEATAASWLRQVRDLIKPHL